MLRVVFTYHRYFCYNRRGPSFLAAGSRDGIFRRKSKRDTVFLPKTNEYETRTTTWNLPGPSGTRDCINIVNLSHPSPLYNTDVIHNQKTVKVASLLLFRHILNNKSWLEWCFSLLNSRMWPCKMRLTSLHDSYGSWHLYICRSLFGHPTIFAALLVFMKGTSCSVTGRNFMESWAVRLCCGKFL